MIPRHGACGRGGRQRCAPGVDAAYGTPRNSRTAPLYRPRILPPVVRPTSGACLTAAGPEVPAAAAPTVVSPADAPSASAAAQARIILRALLEDAVRRMAASLSRPGLSGNYSPVVSHRPIGRSIGAFHLRDADRDRFTEVMCTDTGNSTTRMAEAGRQFGRLCKACA